MQATITTTGQPTHVAPANLLGQNCEMCGDVYAGLLAERLYNPKFTGPASPVTGIARGWQPGKNSNYAGIRFELVPGLFLSGNESQLIHNFTGVKDKGLLQTQRRIRAGETLQVTLWARAQHHPVTLTVGLRPEAGPAAPYVKAELPITATYWKCYTTTLQVPADDDLAVFFIFLEEEGMVYIDQAHLWPVETGELRRDLYERLRTLQMPVLRFPGGCISTNYHWKFGTGPRHLRPALPDPVFKWEMSYDFGTDEYLELCVEQGIMPQISVNIGSGTPEEAGEWAAYVANWFRQRGIEPPAMYWQMGNEHYGAWEVGNMSGDLYADALREFVPAVKANYPNARIIALGPTDGEILGQERQPWRIPVLEKAGDLVDVLAIQYYVGPWGVAQENPRAYVYAGVNGAMATLQQALEDIHARNLPITVAMTEWNLWQQAAHYDSFCFLETYDVEHALFTAAMLNGYTRLAPELELTNFYNLINVMGFYRMCGPTIDEALLADVFRLYRPAFPGQFVPLEVQAPAMQEGVPLVDATCLRTEEATWLFVQNRSGEEAATINLTGLAGDGTGVVLRGAAPNDRCFAEEAIELHNSQLTLPPLSMARVQVG